MSGTTLVYGAFSDYLERALLNHVFGATAYARPTGLYVALYTTSPSDTTAGTEPAGGLGYARLAATFAAIADLNDGSSAMANNNVLQFAVATAPWGTVIACGIHDAAIGGNMLAYGTLAAPKDVGSGDAVRFAANQLVVGLQ